jgi:hypothetical protein
VKNQPDVPDEGIFESFAKPPRPHNTPPRHITPTPAHANLFNHSNPPTTHLTHSNPFSLFNSGSGRFRPCPCRRRKTQNQKCAQDHFRMGAREQPTAHLAPTAKGRERHGILRVLQVHLQGTLSSSKVLCVVVGVSER